MTTVKLFYFSYLRLVCRENIRGVTRPTKVLVKKKKCMKEKNNFEVRILSF